MRMPREHGLIMIWGSTLLLGITQGLFHLSDPLGLIIGIFFGISIVLSYNSINHIVQSRTFSKLIEEKLPVTLLLSSSALAFFWRINFASLLFFGILLLLLGIWALHSIFIGGRVSYTRSIIGTMLVSLQFPIIFNLSVLSADLEYMVAMWWLYFGVTLILILAVGNYREKVFRHVTLGVWIIFLTLTLPFFVSGVLHPTASIFLIDPSMRSIYHSIANPTFKKKRMNIKKVGWNLTFSTFLFLMLASLLTVAVNFQIITSLVIIQ